MDAFPIFLDVAGRTALVFGGGVEAAAKLRLLLKTRSHVLVVAERLVPDEIELGAARWIRADPAGWPIPPDTAIAYVATDERATDAAIARRYRLAGVTVCAADQPDVLDFSTPVIIDRNPVVVAIGTEGTAPVLAREIKGRVEGLLPATLGPLARAAASLRANVAERLAPSRLRRTFWQAMFAPGLDGEIRTAETFGQRAAIVLDHLKEAAPFVESSQSRETTHAGRVAFVGAGPGSAELLTRRAAYLLDRADVVLHDALVAPDVLKLARREAVLIDVGKRAGRHATDQRKIEQLLVEHAASGASVVRLKGGDPSLFGRLAGEIDAVRALSIACEVVPGVTSASAASAAALAALTERGLAQEVRLVTAHSEHGDAQVVDWTAAARTDAPLAVYMGRHNARGVQRRLVLAGRDTATPVVLVESAGRSDQRIAHATLGGLGDAVDAMKRGDGGDGPLMMLIGVRSRLAPDLSRSRTTTTGRATTQLERAEAA